MTKGRQIMRRRVVGQPARIPSRRVRLINEELSFLGPIITIFMEQLTKAQTENNREMFDRVNTLYEPIRLRNLDLMRTLEHIDLEGCDLCPSEDVERIFRQSELGEGTWFKRCLGCLHMTEI